MSISAEALRVRIGCFAGIVLHRVALVWKSRQELRTIGEGV